MFNLIWLEDNKGRKVKGKKEAKVGACFSLQKQEENGICEKDY